MEYPKLSCELDNRVKICKDVYPRIRNMYKNGKNLKELADLFKVSKSTIKRIINPEYAENMKTAVRKYNHKRYHNDPEYKQYMIDRACIGNMTRMQKNPLLKTYLNEKTKEWQKSHKAIWVPR